MVAEKTEGKNRNELFFPQIFKLIGVWLLRETEGENGNLKFESFFWVKFTVWLQRKWQRNEKLIIILIIIFNSEYVMNSIFVGQIAV